VSLSPASGVEGNQVRVAEQLTVLIDVVDGTMSEQVEATAA
jgi:hypothetical protein